MMKAMEKMVDEKRVWTVTNGLMDGTYIGAIIAAIAYGAVLLMRCMFFGASLSNWIDDTSWDSILTLVMFLATVVSYWVFCDISHDWRGYIDSQLEHEAFLANEVYFYRENRTRLVAEACQKREQLYRPERHFGRERRIYRIIRCSIVLLLGASALALSASGLLVLKLALTAMVVGVAVFTSKCHNRIVFGCE